MENKEPKKSRWFFWFIALMLLALALWSFRHYEQSEFARKTVTSVGSNSVIMNAFYIVIAIAGLVVLLHFMGKFQRRSFGGSNNVKSYVAKKNAEKIITFADVAGIDEAKEELAEIVDFLRHGNKYGKLGGHMPKGVLFIGPPGTGKTLLAKALAGEAGVPFLWMSGSEFVEMFVGVGASRVRDLFRQARKKAPCVIFIDELDAIAKQRGAGLGQNHNENEQSLNQILVEMDGFGKDDNVVVVAATNRPDVLDSAILRPGRFDRQVTVPRPDLKGRYEILKVHVREKKIHESVDFMVLARGTPGASGADLANLANEAALVAERKDKNAIEQEDFEEAFEKILMGKEKPMIISEKERRIVAFHEAGHTIVLLNQPNADPLYKVSIVPHGKALGVTLPLPTEDRFTLSRTQIVENVHSLLGGRAAEEVILGDVTDGASNDLKRATALFKQMIECGMDEEMGLASFEAGGDNPFLGRALALGSGVSQETQYKVEQRVIALLAKHYQEVKRMLGEKTQELRILAEALLERETLTGKEIKQLLGY